jgi:hypothetical protein
VGLWDSDVGPERIGEGAWKGPPERVIVPYPKSELALGVSRVPRGTCNLAGSRVDRHPRLNTFSRPIVNKYREGKVKRTPVRGVKEYLKPCAYKQWKDDVWFRPDCLTACLLLNEPASYVMRQG